MLNLAQLPLFVLASAVLLLTPGPAVLYIVARSMDQGRLAGLVSVLSIESGNLVHVVLAALGLSALLVSSPLAFGAVKYLGAAYLLYLGARKLLSPAAHLAPAHAGRQSLRQIYQQGVVVATFNPKTALFFLAFLPQFVDRAKGPPGLQMLLLGGLFVLMAVLSDGAYALLASTAGGWLKRHDSVWRFERYVVGSVYLGLGLSAALSGRLP